MFSVQRATYISWNVQTLLNRVRTLIYPFGSSFLIHLFKFKHTTLIGVTPIQVQAHDFNRHQPWGLPAFLPPPPAFPALPPPPLHQGLGAGRGPSPSGAAAALPSGGVAGVAVSASAGSVGSAGSAGSASGASPVLELALDHQGLGATAGAHNPLDLLVIGGQDGLQLWRERCQASFWSILPTSFATVTWKVSGFILEYTSNIVPSCSSACAFMLSLKKSWWWVHSDVIDILYLLYNKIIIWSA